MALLHTTEGADVLTISAIQSVPASTVGALSGFEAKCSCGMALRSSLRSILEADVQAHAAYHERKGA